MRKCLFTIIGLFTFSIGFAQNQAKAADEYLAKYKAAVTPADKVEFSGKAAQLMMTVNPAMADSLGQKSIEIAEMSRDRKLMFKAYMYNGQRNGYFGGMKDYVNKSQGFYQKAYNIARTNKLDEETSESLIALSQVQRMIPDADKAMTYTNEAFAIISNLKNDSLLCLCYIELGENYMMKQEKLLALRNYFNASRIAETEKNPSLLKSAYSGISKFFVAIDDYDKALDYAVKAKDQISRIGGKSEKYLLVNDLYYIGSLYRQTRSNDIAKSYYEDGIRIADSLKFETLKVPGYLGILNLYLTSDPRKALNYFNDNQAIKPFLVKFGLGSIIDQSYGIIYLQLNMLDSARFFLERSRPFFENTANLSNRMSYYEQLGMLYRKSGEYPKAIDMYTKLNEGGIQTNDLDLQRSATKNLDSVYLAMGNYKEASVYLGQYYRLKDRLDSLGKEKDLQQLQIADEQQREERLKEEALKEEERRHNIQYMGITVGIGFVFFVLVMMGMFNVSVKTIKTLGFFAFIFLFEFIILIADNIIHHWTHGEPWKVLLIKIVLIAILLPLHHYLEHKVIQYITTRRLVKEQGVGWLRHFFKRRDVTAHSTD